MSKKIVSSLIIASYCLSNLPVCAGKNLFRAEQMQGNKVQSRKASFSEKQEIDFSNQRRTHISGPVDPKMLLAALTSLLFLRPSEAAPTGGKKRSTCDTTLYSQEKLKDFFYTTGANHAYILPTPKIGILSSGKVEADYGSMSLSLHDFQRQVESQKRNFFATSLTVGGDCAVYQTLLGKTSQFGLADRNEQKILENFAIEAIEKKFSELFNSRPKEHIALPETGTYGFINFLQNIEEDKDKGIFKASLGHSRLDFHQYTNEETSKPHLVAFYDGEKTIFALRDQDDYVRLRMEYGNQLAQLGNEATLFLKSLFEKNVVKNYFPEEMGTVSTAKIFLPEVFLDPSYDSASAPMLAHIPDQLPSVNVGSGYNLKDMGIGAAAVGGVAAVVAGACLLKKYFGKPKRSNRSQKSLEISLPTAICPSSNSPQASMPLVPRKKQNVPIGTIPRTAERTELYEQPRVFPTTSLRLSDRPATYVEVDEYLSSTDSGYLETTENTGEIYMEMRALSPESNPVSNDVNLDEGSSSLPAFEEEDYVVLKNTP